MKAIWILVLVLTICPFYLTNYVLIDFTPSYQKESTTIYLYVCDFAIYACGVCGALAFSQMRKESKDGDN